MDRSLPHSAVPRPARLLQSICLCLCPLGTFLLWLGAGGAGGCWPCWGVLQHSRGARPRQRGAAGEGCWPLAMEPQNYNCRGRSVTHSQELGAWPAFLFCLELLIITFISLLQQISLPNMVLFIPLLKWDYIGIYPKLSDHQCVQRSSCRNVLCRTVYHGGKVANRLSGNNTGSAEDSRSSRRWGGESLLCPQQPRGPLTVRSPLHRSFHLRPVVRSPHAHLAPCRQRPLRESG